VAAKVLMRRNRCQWLCDVLLVWYNDIKRCHKCTNAKGMASWKLLVVVEPGIADIQLTMWPRGQNFGLGLGLEALTSASRFWPRPGLDLVVLLCNRAFLVQKLCKIPELC